MKIEHLILKGLLLLRITICIIALWHRRAKSEARSQKINHLSTTCPPGPWATLPPPPTSLGMFLIAAWILGHLFVHLNECCECWLLSQDELTQLDGAWVILWHEVMIAVTAPDQKRREDQPDSGWKPCQDKLELSSHSAEKAEFKRRKGASKTAQLLRFII